MLILFGTAVFFAYIAYEPLFVTTAKAEATVTSDIRISCDLEACYEYAEVTFETDSGQQTTAEIEGPDRIAPGDQLAIYYDPDDPTNAMHESTRWPVFVAVAIAVASLVGGFALIRKVRRGY